MKPYVVTYQCCNINIHIYYNLLLVIISKHEDWKLEKIGVLIDDQEQEEQGGLLLTVETQSSPAQSDQLLFKLNQSQQDVRFRSKLTLQPSPTAAM